MKNKYFAIIVAILLSAASNAQQTETGSIAFTAFNADGTDVMSFVVLKEIPAGASIFFTDNNWDGIDFNANEGFLEWANDAPTAPGTIVTITGTSIADVGIVVPLSGTFNLEAENEAVYAYTGISPTIPEFFLAAASNNDYSEAVGILALTGLVDGETAINIGDDNDIGVIDVTIDCTGDDRITCATKFNTVADWITQNDSGDDSSDGIAPDVPDDIVTGHIIPSVYGTLPIELTNFSAVKNGHRVELSWQTASEINNDRFEIQRSSDASRFESIGKVDGEGNSQRLVDYAYTDEDPMTGVNYYRLMQVDIDGTRAFSDVISVKMDKSTRIRITPTSTLDFVTVNTGEASSIIVRSLNGQVMNNQSDAEGNFTVEMANYPQGIYYLTININGSIQTEKVVRL